MTTIPIPATTSDAAAKLYRQATGYELARIEPLTGGRNNRVYRLISPHGTAILKQYFRGPPGSRDRFRSEVAWYEFCNAQAIPQVPRLLGCDAHVGCALLTEAPGNKLDADQIEPHHVAQAISFFQELNRRRHAPLASQLPLAAEACWSLPEYLTGVERRLLRLQGVTADDESTREMQGWLRDVVTPLWTEIAAQSAASARHFTPSAVDGASNRCLSPSDFGFHNAVQDDQGTVWFFDFEYAGWDDPAKTVCDFYWQVERPAPRSTLPEFLAAAAEFGSQVPQRVQTLFPVFGIKWALIVLNEFLADSQERREFSSGDSGYEARSRQLTLAQRLVARVTTSAAQDVNWVNRVIN